jgi:hypothetical protein
MPPPGSAATRTTSSLPWQPAVPVSEEINHVIEPEQHGVAPARLAP